jgi:hypothetical protein
LWITILELYILARGKVDKMKISYTPETYSNGGAPAINATRLNASENGIKANADAISSLPTDPATFNVTGSSSSNYNVTSYRTGAPDAGEYPLSIIITPTITNAAGVTITPSWGADAYPIYDRSTNAQVVAGVIKANQPVQVEFDSAKFWITGGGAYLQVGVTANTNGYFDRGVTAPTGTSRLNYSGYMYATRFVGAVFNETASDFAEGYEVLGDIESGEAVMVRDDGVLAKNVIRGNTKIIGICSDEFGCLLGTKYGTTPIAEAGRVHAKVNGSCNAGDYLFGDSCPGVLAVCDPETAPRGSICARALETKCDTQTGKVFVQIVRM